MKTYILLTILLILSCGCSKKIVQQNDCKGKAIEDCICTMQYDPVCGCDGETYGNACVANCAGVKIVSKGECNQNTQASNYATLTVIEKQNGKDGYTAILKNNNGDFFAITISIPNWGGNYVDLEIGDKVKIEGNYEDKASWIDYKGKNPTYIKATKVIKQ